MSAILNSKADFSKVRKEFGDLFWFKHERYIFNKLQRYVELTFEDFMLVLDDYYLIKYSTRMNKNSWLVFSWIRYLTRNDGFVAISYNEIIDMFCNEDFKISKPTFFKCIDELINLDLVVKLPTFKIYGDNFTKDKNVYAIRNKGDIVYNACDNIQNFNVSISDAFKLLEGTKTIELPSNDKEKKDVKKKPKIKSTTKMKLLMNKFDDISESIETFFTFLGSFNESGSIAITRKVKILESLKQYLDGGFTLEDIEYALNVTMKNTAKGGNNKKERYMFAILDNQTEKEVTENTVANEISEKVSEKLMEQNKENYVYSDVMDKSAFDSELKKVLNYKSKYYDIVIDKYGSSTSEYEVKLFKVAKVVRYKVKLREKNQAMEKKRRRYLLSRFNIVECFDVDRNLNRTYYWHYEDDEDNLIPYEVIKNKLSNSDVVFELTKYDKVKEV